MLSIKRIYDKPDAADGYRVLIDRLWPRGVKKDQAVIDLWLKDIAPTPELRTWFNHQPERFDEFSLKYYYELSINPDPVNQLEGLIKAHPKVTLLYAAKDPKRNNAVALKTFIQSRKHS